MIERFNCIINVNNNNVNLKETHISFIIRTYKYYLNQYSDTVIQLSDGQMKLHLKMPANTK